MNLERAANFLASGLKPSQVATILGVSPARISQLLSTPEFTLLLSSKQVEAEKSFDEQKLIEARYLSAEYTLLNTIQEQAGSCDIRDAVGALRVITERQFRKASLSNPIQSGNTVINNTVVLNMPRHAVPEVFVNELNEVTSIGQQALAPLSSQGVENLFRSMKGNNNELRKLPESSAAILVEALPSQAATKVLVSPKEEDLSDVF